MGRASLLLGGKVKAGSICPFRVKCSSAAKGECRHLGYVHTVDFSCGYARAHDIVTPDIFKCSQGEAECQHEVKQD